MNIWQGTPQLNTGDVIYPPGGRLGPRVQRNLQLVYVWSGRMRVVVNGTRTDVRAREAILLLPHRREQFSFADDTSTHHGWCEVVQPTLEPAFERQLAALEGVVLQTPSPVRSLADTALRLKEDRRWGSRRAYREICTAILHVFAAGAGVHEPPGLRAMPQQLPSPIVRAIEWIHGDPAGVESMAAVASRVGVTQQHLARLFKQHVGVTPAAYLWNVRTEKAVELITSTGLTLSDVAHQSGFKTQFHLSRRVREKTGVPPSDLRDTENETEASPG